MEKSLKNNVFNIFTLSNTFIFFGLLLQVPSAYAVIPVSHIKGIDELFKDDYKIYSPLTGMMNYRTFIYEAFEASTESQTSLTLSALISQLFSRVPGGEITASHQNKNPGAHLSTKAIGSILGEIAGLKSLDLSFNDLYLELVTRIQFHIVSDPTYQLEIEASRSKKRQAEDELSALLNKFEEDKIHLAQAETFKESEITVLDRKIKKLRQKLRPAPTTPKARLTDAINFDSAMAPLEPLDLENELKEFERQRAHLVERYNEMKTGLLTNLQKKDAERKLKYLIDTNEVDDVGYEMNLKTLVNTLAESFIKYDLHITETPAELRFSTTVSLLSYLWMKYLDKADLLSYVEAVSNKFDVLNQDLWNHRSPEFSREYYTNEEYLALKGQFLKSWRKDKWTRTHLATSIAISLDSPTTNPLPPVISFSFLKWVKYSLFPDCCEFVLHNIINLMAFNPTTGQFDYRILEQLKERYFPNMNDRLINYYREFATAEQHQSIAGAAAWITVVSNLNDGLESLPEEQQIHYRNAHSHVASPYSNLVKIVNRLFGLDNVQVDKMAEIFSRVQEISGFEIVYSNRDIDDEGFGTARFVAKQGVFRADAYRPIHSGFSLQKNTLDSFEDKIAEIFLRKFSRKHQANEVKNFLYRSGNRLLTFLGLNS